MVDIIPADKDKLMLKVAMWWLRKKYVKKGHKKNIHEDMQNCGNPVIAKIYKKIVECAQIKSLAQKNSVINFSELALWICYRDTGYRDPFFYTLKQILEMKDELMPLIDKYYKEPEDFYVNRWVDVKNNTQKAKDEGVLPDFEGQMSYDETFYTPQIQEGRVKAIIKETYEKELNDEYEKEKRSYRNKQGQMFK